MQVFALAAECAMERSRLVPVEEALDLWALAASLQVKSLDILEYLECLGALLLSLPLCCEHWERTAHTEVEQWPCSPVLPPSEAMLWAAQMPEILRRCERVIASSALQDNRMLETALRWTRNHKDSGAAFTCPQLCSPQHVLAHPASATVLFRVTSGGMVPSAHNISAQHASRQDPRREA